MIDRKTNAEIPRPPPFLKPTEFSLWSFSRVLFGKQQVFIGVWLIKGSTHSGQLFFSYFGDDGPHQRFNLVWIGLISGVLDLNEWTRFFLFR